jgi:hypothetical protein
MALLGKLRQVGMFRTERAWLLLAAHVVRAGRVSQSVLKTDIWFACEVRL